MIRIPGNKLNTPTTFPSVMSKSRDYNSIDILFQTLFSYFYTRSLESKNVHNPLRCDVNLLPMLADYFRYEYTDTQNIELERQIIAAVPYLHHYKGTATGIQNALNLSKVDKSTSVNVPWYYNNDNTITVLLYDNVETYKLMKLLKLVLPLGTKVIFRVGFGINASEEIQLATSAEINPYGVEDNQNKVWNVTPNETGKDINADTYSEYVSEQVHLDATRIGNTEVYKEVADTGEAEEETNQ